MKQRTLQTGLGKNRNFLKISKILEEIQCFVFQFQMSIKLQAKLN